MARKARRLNLIRVYTPDADPEHMRQALRTLLGVNDDRATTTPTTGDAAKALATIDSICPEATEPQLRIA